MSSSAGNVETASRMSCPTVRSIRIQVHERVRAQVGFPRARRGHADLNVVRVRQAGPRHRHAPERATSGMPINSSNETPGSSMINVARS